MPIANGFGLSDAPFSANNGFLDFALPTLPASSAGRASSTSSTTTTSSSGGTLFDSFLGTIGSAVERVADFGTNLFIFDELAERGFTILRFWNDEVRNDLVMVCDTILAATKRL